ncbi:MAG: phosphotransferase, partial [Pelagibacteraceae bacterium]|nr:phosphotransferase [Pelagibacteraceae bacterium]
MSSENTKILKKNDEKKYMGEGEVVTEQVYSRHRQETVEKFKYFLDWMNGFWIKKKLSTKKEKEFYKNNLAFYKDKTHARVQQYFARFEQLDSKEFINGIETPKLMEILDMVDWKYLSEESPYSFHGDLHFENILINDTNNPPFTLLDWRQEYGGSLEYGDIYYDFAKLNHGFIICHELINKNLYELHHKLSVVEYDFLRKSSLVE